MQPSLLVFAAASCLATLPGQGVTWAQLRPNNSPQARWSPGMAYDSTRDRVVLFGGRAVGGWFNDTWEWDGMDWTQQQPGPNTPSPRTGNDSMVYDAARQRVLLFGGWNAGISTFYDETWEWDGSRWTQRQPTTRPPARGLHSVAYDCHRQRAVLFGGSNGNNLGDTWEWDGSDWTQRQPANSPPPRRAHAMVYDAARGRVLLFGGIPSSGGRLNDTWLWDGTNWTQVSPSTTPPPLSWILLAYDSARQRAVLFGGIDSSGSVNDTWEWTGSTWLQRTPLAVVGPRCCTDLTYIGSTGRCLAFGGSLGNQNAIADTIEYGPTHPAAVSQFGAGCAGTVATPRLDAAAGSRPWLGESLSIELGGIPDGVALLLAGASNTSWGNWTLPFPLAGIGMPGCDLLISVAITLPAAASGGMARFSLPICGSCTNLLGVAAHFQGVATDPLANVAGLIVSNGLTGTIGMK